MRITPINDAEAIIDPLWDAYLSELSQWSITPDITSDNHHGLQVSQNWCCVNFQWTRQPATGPALKMMRTCGIDCSDYDRLVLSLMLPRKATIRLHAQTDRELRTLEFQMTGDKKKELALDLRGAMRLETVAIEIEAGEDGLSLGWFNWLGLQNSDRLARKLKTQSSWDSRWENFLKDETYEPQFTPTYGLMLKSDELGTLRKLHAQLVATGSSSPFVAAAQTALALPPESQIRDFVNFWADSRFNRERDHDQKTLNDKSILNHGLNAAIAGHLLRDKNLLRLAARYAMSIGMCGKWADGFICYFPGSTFDHRCFVQSLCAYEVAGILDLAGEFFTDAGRDFLLRRLAEEAIGVINYNSWRYDYIFDCNQLSWFMPGRMLALAVLNKHMPRVRPQLDMAYAELCENLDRTVLPDGGYMEGPDYFRCVGRDAGLSVYYYCRALGKSMHEMIPSPIKRCGDFAEALASTDDNIDMVPICDARKNHELLSQAIMATLLPQSAWLRILRKTVARNQGWPVNFFAHGPMMADAAVAWSLIEKLPQQVPVAQPLVSLPQMGPLVSHRKFGEHWVKLLIQGNKSGAGHTHEDKGSFVLEFAGETFAMDPGTCDYGNPLSGILRTCQRHNMLVPFGTTQRPAPACPLHHDVRATGHGNEHEFHALIDASPGWDNYYQQWTRSWDSPDPATLVIRDQWKLIQGNGVEWYWQTQRPVTIENQTITLTGKHGSLCIKAPDDAQIRIDTLPLLDGTLQTRITLVFLKPEGTATVHIKLANR